MIAKSHCWQKTAIAAAALALLSLSGTGALALSLGRLTVQSALGEPLRAEIEVPDINAEEAASLRTRVAPPEAFVAAGLEYNPAMASLQASLQRRPDGRAFIRLSSDRPINEPFVDLILETNWASGRIVRDFTMLFDPPVLRRAAVTPTLPQTPPPALPVTRAPVVPSASVSSSGEPTRHAATPKPTERPAPVAKPEPESANKRVVVKPGDTASKIAGKATSAGVSLDQMLVALLRSNPDAFVHDNINRIRAGAVLNMPSAELASSIPAAEATQIVVAQSKDFNEFRRSLAANAPTAAVGAANRQASGTIDTKVEDKKSVATTPDKLTLSKGAVQGKASDEKIAQERADKDAAARAAEIAKNISDLTKLGAASTPVSAAAPAPTASEPARVDTPALPVAAVAPDTAASAPVAVASAPLEMASAPQSAASVAAKAPPVAAIVPTEPPGLMDELLENPLVPAAAGGLVALLAGLAFYRVRQRRKDAEQVDSSFLESRLQQDSFFGASGGQRVDTNHEGSLGGSSMVYSPSQMDSADDVDPVAEADVYLAYGRDLQAEEILKEAVRATPSRLAIHTKLLEIFAKRRDAKSFEATATQAYKIAGNDSPEWARICEMGLGFDPGNPLYQPGGMLGGASAPASPEAGASSSFGSTAVQSAHAELPVTSSATDLDLDLDFSLDDEPVSAISDVTGGSATPPVQEPVTASNDYAMEMDFDLSEPAPLASVEPATAPAMPEIDLDIGLSLAEDEASQPISFDATSPAPVQKAPAPVADAQDGLLEFDLGSLSLDLEPPAEVPTEAPTDENEDPLETKLALADEFISIGDEDGARALIEEVVAEATGDMRAKAQRALANLS